MQDASPKIQDTTTMFVLEFKSLVFYGVVYHPDGL